MTTTEQIAEQSFAYEGKPDIPVGQTVCNYRKARKVTIEVEVASHMSSRRMRALFIRLLSGRGTSILSISEDE